MRKDFSIGDFERGRVFSDEEILAGQADNVSLTHMEKTIDGGIRPQHNIGKSIWETDENGIIKPDFVHRGWMILTIRCISSRENLSNPHAENKTGVCHERNADTKNPANKDHKITLIPKMLLAHLSQSQIFNPKAPDFHKKEKGGGGLENFLDNVIFNNGWRVLPYDKRLKHDLQNCLELAAHRILLPEDKKDLQMFQPISPFRNIRQIETDPINDARTVHYGMEGFSAK